MEPEFTNHIKTIIANSVSTYETAARNAKRNGALYGRIFSCTPGDLDTACGQEAQEILAETTKWTEKMYDKHWDPNDPNCELLAYVRDNGSNGIVYIEYSYKQIGLTDEWMRNIADKIQDPITVKREILLQRLRGSSDSPFDQEDLEYIISSAQSIAEEIFILDHFRVDVYTPLSKSIPYLVGVDCSTGTNSDNNAVTIIDPYTVKPVAEFKCPYIGETLFEKFLIELVQKHIPRAIVIIERNSVGDGIIDHLMSSPINHRLYFDKNRDILASNISDQSTVVSMLKKQGEQKKYYGVYTEGTSRETMMAILFRHVAEYKDNFVTKNITEDIAHLVRAKSGKILAVAPFHDDCIMSYLIAMYVFYHGNNLPAFGFIKGSQEIENQNEGLDYSDINTLRGTGLVPDDMLEVEAEREQIRKENDYSAIYQEAVMRAQQESMELARRGLVRNATLDATPSTLLTDMYEEGEIDMNFFDELNNF